MFGNVYSKNICVESSYPIGMDRVGSGYIYSTRVQLGDTVVVKYLDTDKTREFVLSGGCERSYDRGVISVSSPMGSAVFSKTKGRILEVGTPSGVKKIQILEIKKAM